MFELRLEAEARYDDYLYATEQRGISYGEVVHIEGLSRRELEDFIAEIDKAENKIEKGENHDR